MKKRDVIYLLLAVAIMLVAGYLAVTQLAPKKTGSSDGVVVEKIGRFEDHISDVGLSRLRDPGKVTDFSSPVDFNGLNNQAPFGP